MTVQYDGNAIYTIYLGNRTVILSQDEINEIQGFNFPMMKEIDENIEELQDIIDNLEEKLSDAETKIDKKDDEILELTLQITEYEAKGGKVTTE